MPRRTWTVVLALVLSLPAALAQSPVLAAAKTLKITSESVPSLCVIRTIDDSGIVWLPVVGYVPAVNMDLARFEARLETMLSDKLGRHCKIKVELCGIPGDPVLVDGLVKAKLSKTWTLGLTAKALLRDVELSDDADKAHATLIQNNGVRLELDLGGPDIDLQPGDILEFGPRQGSDLIVVVGPVVKPGTLTTSVGMTLSAAITQAGGLTGHADASRLTLRRKGQTDKILDLTRDGSMPLLAGDWISVGMNESTLHVSVTGNVPHPGLVDFKTGMTLMEAIRAAGLDPMRVGDLVTVTRILDKAMRSTKYHLSRIIAKIDPDPILEPADSVALGGR